MFKAKILIAASTYPPDPGGPALHAQKYFEGFKERGYKTGLVSLSHFRKWPIGLRQLFFFFMVLVKVPKYDLVYAHDAIGTGIPAYIAAKIFRKKFIVRVGGDLAWERRVEGGATNKSLKEWYGGKEHIDDKFFKLSRWLLRKAEAVVVPSKLLSDLYISEYRVNSEKIFFIPNPIPTTRQGLKSINNSIVYASRLVAYKNLDIVIRSLSSIFKDHLDLRLIIIGSGPERGNLENLTNELNTQNNVEFTGPISEDEVGEYLSSAKIVIAPALTEFNPNYLLKAISYGKPFLISRENGIPFHIPEEFLFDSRNQTELRDKMTNILNNYQESLLLIKKINFHMTWNEVLDKNVYCLDKVLKG